MNKWGMVYGMFIIGTNKPPTTLPIPEARSGERYEKESKGKTPSDPLFDSPFEYETLRKQTETRTLQILWQQSEGTGEV